MSIVTFLLHVGKIEIKFTRIIIDVVRWLLVGLEPAARTARNHQPSAAEAGATGDGNDKAAKYSKRA